MGEKMKNLAGNNDCDVEIEKELKRSRIEIVFNQPREGEVASSLRGKIRPFKLKRAWTYWMVSGSFPLGVAEELYADSVGKTDIRVSGHCGCPPPASEVVWKTADGKTVLPKSQEVEWILFAEKSPFVKKEMINFIFNDDPSSVGAKPYIESY